MKTDQLVLRIEPALRERIDEWRQRQDIVPTRSAAVRYMVANWLRDQATGMVDER